MFVSKKYPLPASAVRVVEPSATVTACQSTRIPTDEVAPNDIDLPLIVKDELTNLSLAIEPASCVPVIEPYISCA